jgi:hypothetical protein
MADKPEGPIWIDMTDALMDLPIRTVVAMANHAMNRLTARDIGEICGELGVTPYLELHDKEARNG